MPFEPILPTRPLIRPAMFGIAVACVAVLQIALIASHDYFVDEWQALQIAVQSPDLPALLGNLRYEGHPPLWYLLLRVLGQIVGPAHALMAASLLCSLATIAIVAIRAPLPRGARLALLIGEPLLFEFGTVARSYALGVTLTFLCLAFWQRRRAVWCILALLPLVDFVFGLMALGLIALLVVERGREAIWIPGAAIFAVASAFAAWSVIPAPDFVSVYRPTTGVEEFARWANQLGMVGLPVQWDHAPLWGVPWNTPFTPLLGAAYLLVVFHQTRRCPVQRAVALGLPVVLLAFMLTVHTLAIRHLMLAGVMFAAVLWRQSAGGVPMRWPTRAWLAAGAVCGMATAFFALTRPFDTAPGVVRYIRQNGLEQESWLTFPAQHAQGISALSGIGFEGVELGCRQDFIRWNFTHRASDPLRLRDWLVREARAGGTFYLVSQYVPAAGRAAIRPIATIQPGLDGKIYHLFRVQGAHPGRRPVPARCVPGTVPMAPLLRG